MKQIYSNYFKEQTQSYDNIRRFASKLTHYLAGAASSITIKLVKSTTPLLVHIKISIPRISELRLFIESVAIATHVLLDNVAKA